LKLRNYGQSERYKHDINGINSRLDEIQAAVLNIKIQKLSEWNKRRIEIATKYLKAFPSENILDFKKGSVFHLFPLLVNNRENFMDYLASVKIKSLIHYPIPVSKQKAFTGKALKNLNAESLCKRIVSIPICPELTDNEVDYIISKVRDYLN